MLEILIPLNIKFTFKEEFTITNLSEKIHDLEIEKVITNMFINKYDELITTELCGEKYKHDKKSNKCLILFNELNIALILLL
jgi:hypothetical protein